VLPSLSLLEYVAARMPPPKSDGCQIWTGSLNSNGYGKISLWGIGTYYVHRVSYGITHGHVPPELDHLCHTRACCRADHLEPVTHAENLRRAGVGQTLTCRAGHNWNEVGWWDTGRGRKCKACHRRRALESLRRKRPARG
jgi:HNH endonuclease